MKRFLVFFGDKYYPQGGILDFIGDFRWSDEAIRFLFEKEAKENNSKTETWEDFWGHVYDTHTQKIVWSSDEEEIGKEIKGF